MKGGKVKRAVGQAKGKPDCDETRRDERRASNKTNPDVVSMYNNAAAEGRKERGKEGGKGGTIGE